MAILCPGQGAQAPGISEAWCDASAEARAVFDEFKSGGRNEPGQRVMFIAFGAGLTRGAVLWRL